MIKTSEMPQDALIEALMGVQKDIDAENFHVDKKEEIQQMLLEGETSYWICKTLGVSAVMVVNAERLLRGDMRYMRDAPTDLSKTEEILDPAERLLLFPQ